MGDAHEGARRSSAGSPRSPSRSSCSACTSTTSPTRRPAPGSEPCGFVLTSTTTAERTLRHPWIVAAVASVARGRDMDQLGARPRAPLGTIAHRVAQRRTRLGGAHDLADDAGRHTVVPDRRRARDRASCAATGSLPPSSWSSASITWFGAQGVKQIVHRERPFAFLPEIHVREGTGNGLGYLSGHSAMARPSVAVVALTVVSPPLVAVAVRRRRDRRASRARRVRCAPAGRRDRRVGFRHADRARRRSASIDRHRRRAAPAPLP